LWGILGYKLFQTQAPKVDVSVNIWVVLRLGGLVVGDLGASSDYAVQDGKRIGRFDSGLRPELITKG